MSKLYNIQELVSLTGLQERTVRYYLNKVLKAPGGTRGRKAFYPRETLDQLMLAKKVLMQEYDPNRGEVKPSLSDFQNWLWTLSAKDIQQMLEMPYRIKPRVLLEASAPVSSSMQAAGDSGVSYSIKNKPESWSSSKEDKKKTTDSAAQYLNRVMATKQEPEPPRQQQWQSFRFGSDLEIKTCKRLTAEQQDQLRLAGKLLQSMLKER